MCKGGAKGGSMTYWSEKGLGQTILGKERKAIFIFYEKITQELPVFLDDKLNFYDFAGARNQTEDLKYTCPVCVYFSLKFQLLIFQKSKLEFCSSQSSMLYSYKYKAFSFGQFSSCIIFIVCNLNFYFYCYFIHSCNDS